jgi:leucyl-tRNA synthetase
MNADKDAVLAAVKEVPTIASAIEGKSIVKEIYVPNKLANIVVK